MGLRRAARRLLPLCGIGVPALLIRPKERLLYAEVARLSRGSVVLDFGANVGRTVEAFADRGATVHAYEPNPDAFALLTARTGNRTNVRLHNVAVGDHDGRLKLFLHRGYEGTNAAHLESSSFVAEKANVDPDRFYEVPVRDVIGIVAEIGRPIDLVKIDVEGAEYDILDRLLDWGAMKQIARIVVETHEDRIECLRERHAVTAARIVREGLAHRIQLEWE